MDGWINKIDGWLGWIEKKYEKIDGWLNRYTFFQIQMDGWMDRKRWMIGWIYKMDGCMDIKNRWMVGWTGKKE